MKKLTIVIFGLSITSSWGNGHATTFRSLVKALAKRGHTISFFEKDVPWYAAHRDLAKPPFCQTHLYKNVEEVDHYKDVLAGADLIILGSYVADAKAIADKIIAVEPPCFAFYDIDTPVTLAKLDNNDYEYLHPEMIPQFDLYLSFTGGPILNRLEKEYGAQKARPLYCSVDPLLYHGNADSTPKKYTLGYLGTYSDDRQPTVNNLLIETAKKLPEQKFVVAGAQYPSDIDWPENTETIEHIPPHRHNHFYNSQQFTLNVTRRDMINAGYSPSVRLFEAGACATPIISDYWDGLNSFFNIGEEILVAKNSAEVMEYLHMPESERLAIGERIRKKVLNHHTSAHRAAEIENYWLEIIAPAMVVNV